MTTNSQAAVWNFALNAGLNGRIFLVRELRSPVED